MTKKQRVVVTQEMAEWMMKMIGRQEEFILAQDAIVNAVAKEVARLHGLVHQGEVNELPHCNDATCVLTSRAMESILDTADATYKAMMVVADAMPTFESQPRVSVGDA